MGAGPDDRSRKCMTEPSFGQWVGSAMEAHSGLSYVDTPHPSGRGILASIEMAGFRQSYTSSTSVSCVSHGEHSQNLGSHILGSIQIPDMLRCVPRALPLPVGDILLLLHVLLEHLPWCSTYG